MKTLEKYVLASFLTSFLLAFLVLTFVLTIGLMFQIVGYILSGLAMSLIGEFVLVSFPETLQWTVPLAILTASVLVFSRLSADSEVSAMRACGVNLYSIMKWPVVFGFACSLLGAWVNNEVVPRGHTVRRNLKAKVSVGNGIDVLRPGIWITDFPKVKIYFTGREGRWIKDLTVIDETSRCVRTIKASSALVTEEGRDVHLDLRDMTLSPIDEDRPGMLRMARYRHVMKDALKESGYTKKISDFRFFELLADIRARGAEIDAARDIPPGDAAAKKGKVFFEAWYAALRPGVWTEDFAQARLRFARRRDEWLEEVEIAEAADGKDGGRTIRAQRAHVVPRGHDIVFDLSGVTEAGVEQESLRYEFDNVLSSSLRERRGNLSKAKVALSHRFVLAAASLCFVLVGIPLGIRAQRRESTIGMALALGIALGYYLCVMLMESLQKHYAIHPEVLIWLPVLASLGLAVWFTRRNL
ncbi:MAG: LptF/LptG family permease [Kiritimatiellia bacterium]